MKRSRNRVIFGAQFSDITSDLVALEIVRRRLYGKEAGAGIVSLPTSRLDGTIPDANMPPFADYYGAADTEGAPSPPVAATAGMSFKHILISWRNPDEHIWRTWRVHEGATSGFTPSGTQAGSGNCVHTTTATMYSVPKAAGTGPFYYKVCAVNTRGELSTYITFGPYTMAKVDSTEITSVSTDLLVAGTALIDDALIASLGVSKLVADEGLIDKAWIDSLDANQVNAGTLTGFTIQTSASGVRVVLSADWAAEAHFHTGAAGDTYGKIWGATDATYSYLYLEGPSGGAQLALVTKIADGSRIAQLSGDALILSGPDGISVSCINAPMHIDGDVEIHNCDLDVGGVVTAGGLTLAASDDYMTFPSAAGNVRVCCNALGKLQYSVDGGAWNLVKDV